MKLNLVLDLDSTLVYSICTTNMDLVSLYLKSPYLMVHYLEKSYIKNKFTHVISLYRPHLFDFLEQLSSMYNIYIYTHAHIEYAQMIINTIQFATDNVITTYNARTDSEIKLKDLHNIKYIDNIDRTIIIDDNPNVWVKEDINKQIIIKRFYPRKLSDDENIKTFNTRFIETINEDIELKKLTKILTRAYEMYSRDETSDEKTCSDTNIAFDTCLSYVKNEYVY